METPLLPDAITYRHREAQPEWVARLREISPISEVVSWLAIRWHADFSRWILYEMVPNRFIDPAFRSELEGEHPDRLPDWARIVSVYQWEMFRKYKVHARPCWVIQGTKGGHKVAFDPADQELCRAQGLPPEPPKPGELPYAPFDERVAQQIIRAKNDLAEFKRKHGTTPAWKRTYAENLRAARAQYVSFINDQFEEPTEYFVEALRKGELENAPRTTKDFVKENEAADENYIQSGRF